MPTKHVSYAMCFSDVQGLIHLKQAGGQCSVQSEFFCNSDDKLSEKKGDSVFFVMN